MQYQSTIELYINLSYPDNNPDLDKLSIARIYFNRH